MRVGVVRLGVEVLARALKTAWWHCDYKRVSNAKAAHGDG
jgi:hypothetical protein